MQNKIPLTIGSANGHSIGIGHVPGRKQLALLSNNTVIAYVPKGRERQAVIFFEKITGSSIQYEF